MLQRIIEKIFPFKNFVTEGIGLIGLIVVGVTAIIPGIPEALIKIILVTTFIIVVGLYIALKRSEHLGRLEEKSVYFINIPCTPGELDDAIEIAQYYFGGDSMKPDVVRAAYRANPFSFIVIRDAAGKVLGYLDHFGLEKERFDDFLNGKLPECDLAENHFVGGCDIVDARRLYIGGIAVKACSKFEAGKITKCLLAAGCDLLTKRYIADDNDFSLYATGYSKEGREILKSIGFGLLSEAERRKDHAPLYWRTVTKKAVVRYRQNNPICKSELVIKFDREPRAYTPTISSVSGGREVAPLRTNRRRTVR